MKKSLILLMFAALGAATLSCTDANYDEVEQTILEDQTSGTTNGGEEVVNKPGSN